MSDKDYRNLLAKNGLPPAPEGEVTYATYVLSKEDWWVKIEGKGWFWLDGREWAKKEWMPSHYGP